MPCNRDCSFGGECTCERSRSSLDDEMRRIDAQGRRRDAILTETSSGHVEEDKAERPL